MSLRSNFPRGGTLWALRRAQWTALGIDDADMCKPKIAVINTSSELSSCYSHLDRVAFVVKEAIRAAGGLPFEINTTAPSDFIHCAGSAGSYILPSRDLMVNDIEVSVEGPQLDGMVCLSSCDKTAPAHLMAAARLDVPTILVIGGYQKSGQLQGEQVDIEDVFEGVGKVGSAEISIDTLECMSRVAVAGPGVCAGMGTANSMHIVSEALGMALPGSAPVAAESDAMYAQARAAGARIVDLVRDEVRPSAILTPKAFYNACVVALSISTSINVMRHLQAVAEEGRIPVNIYDQFSHLDGRVPLLCAVKPNGPSRIEDLDDAGGVRALMKRLEPLLEGSARGIDGRTLAERLADYKVPETGKLGSLENPVAPGPSLVVLKGSLCPDGAIMKLGANPTPNLVFEGFARVFTAQDQAFDALEKGEIVEGDVIILRGLGAKGGPGVASASWFAAALAGSPLSGKTALITDGQLSGLNRGLVVGQIMPEAAMGGPIAVVENGDTIRIDVSRRRVDLLLSSEELASRLEAHGAPHYRTRDGWLGLYQQLVTPLSQGAVLRPDRDHEGGKKK